MRTLVFLLFIFLAGCATHKYLGTEQRAIAKTACGIQEELCSFESNEYGQLTGTYRLQNVGSGTYILTGSAKLVLSEQAALLETISRLQLTFFFFSGDLVVHEERVTVQGRTNEDIEFSKFIESDIDFESSRWVFGAYRVRE